MGEPPKIERIIVEFFAKTLDIILESRIPSACSASSSSTSPPPSLTIRDKWFNLVLRESAHPAVEPWRRIPTSEPMVVDVILLPSNSKQRAPSYRVGALPSSCYVGEVMAPTVLERWTVHYAQISSSNVDVEVPAVYKQAVIMLRALYCTARLLPAHRLSKRIGSACRNHNTMRLVYRVSTSPDPLPRGEMGSWCSTPVETPCGKLCVSVSYIPAIISGGVVETSRTAASLVPQIIPDYVADQGVRRRFQGDSSPVPRKGAHGVSSAPTSPACTGKAIGRCHSWSGGIQCPSPSHCSNPNRMSPLPVPPQRGLLLDHSPSPPTRGRLPPDNASRALLRTESAPVSVPTLLAAKSPTTLAAEYFSPNKSALPPYSSKIRKPGALPRVASLNSGLMSAHVSSTDGSPPLFGKFAVSRSSDFQTSLQAYSSHKVCKDWKDDSGSLSGVKISSSGSPQTTFSRSSSKRSLNYEIEDDEFSCPFAVDDVELDNLRSRIESVDGKGKVGKVSEILEASGRSQDAAVGALVQMLKTAPPLCQVFGNSSDFSLINAEDLRSEHVAAGVCIDDFPSSMESSGLCGCKTAADALKELKSYREIKGSLLSQSETPIVQRSV